MNQHNISKKFKNEEPPIIHSIVDIHKIIEPFRPETGNRPIGVRKLLIDGLQAIKQRQQVIDKHKEFIDNIDEDSVGGYDILEWTMQPNSFHSVDLFIEKKLNAKRDGTNIYWIINNEKIIYDIFTGTLIHEPINRSS